MITAILNNCIPEDQPKLNLVGKSKTPVNCWNVKGFNDVKFLMSESEVVFRQNEFLVGVLDKSHFGATQFGLIHCCFELYGSKVAIQILSGLSRLFPRYLQVGCILNLIHNNNFSGMALLWVLRTFW